MQISSQGQRERGRLLRKAIPRLEEETMDHSALLVAVVAGLSGPGGTTQRPPTPIVIPITNDAATHELHGILTCSKVVTENRLAIELDELRIATRTPSPTLEGSMAALLSQQSGQPRIKRVIKHNFRPIPGSTEVGKEASEQPASHLNL